jgi:hypothetical protein
VGKIRRTDAETLLVGVISCWFGLLFVCCCVGGGKATTTTKCWATILSRGERGLWKTGYCFSPSHLPELYPQKSFWPTTFLREISVRYVDGHSLLMGYHNSRRGT